MNRKIFLLGVVFLLTGGLVFTQETSLSTFLPLEELSRKDLPKGTFTTVSELPPAREYRQFDVYYLSEGLKIYGLLTIPRTPAPQGGYPAVLFVHGYVPPAQWSTVKSYATYQPPLARAGFVTFKPDLRGHGRSEGTGTAHFSDAYTLDLLAALGTLRSHPGVNPERIGYWGHSNGGKLGLRLLVSRSEIKAYSLWAGVVGSYKDMLETWNAKIRFLRVPNQATLAQRLPTENPEFWNPRDPHFFLNQAAGGVEIQHAVGDASVPVELSRSLNTALLKAGKTPVYHEYPGDDHNISRNYRTAWARTVEFFRTRL